jgi:hypothetical protein
MTKQKDQKLVIPPRETQRVRLDLEVGKAAQLREYAARKGLTQAAVVEIFIEKLA